PRRHVTRVPQKEEERAEDADRLQIPEIGEADRNGNDRVARSRNRAERRSPPLFSDSVEQRRNGRAHENGRQVDQHVVMAEHPAERRGHVIEPERVMAVIIAQRRRVAVVPTPRRIHDLPADHLLRRHHVGRAARTDVPPAGYAEHAPRGREREPRTRDDRDPSRDPIDRGRMRLHEGAHASTPCSTPHHHGFMTKSVTAPPTRSARTPTMSGSSHPGFPPGTPCAMTSESGALAASYADAGHG